MTTKVVAGKTIVFDADDHMADVNQWDETVAAALAKEAGIDVLTDQHWMVITFMRKVFLAEGEPPSIRRLTKESGVETKALYALFPKGPAKKAAKIAGLPKPRGCI